MPAELGDKRHVSEAGVAQPSKLNDCNQKQLLVGPSRPTTPGRDRLQRLLKLTPHCRPTLPASEDRYGTSSFGWPTAAGSLFQPLSNKSFIGQVAAIPAGRHRLPNARCRSRFRYSARPSRVPVQRLPAPPRAKLVQRLHPSDWTRAMRVPARVGSPCLA